MVLMAALGVASGFKDGRWARQGLLRMLARPETCNYRQFARAQATLTRQFFRTDAPASSLWTPLACTETALQLGLNLVLLNDQQQILCVGVGDAQNPGAAQLGRIYAQLLQTAPAARLAFYTALASSIASPASAPDIAAFGTEDADLYGTYLVAYAMAALVLNAGYPWDRAAARLSALIPAPTASAVASTGSVLFRFYLLYQQLALSPAPTASDAISRFYNPMLQPWGGLVHAEQLDMATAIFAFVLAFNVSYAPAMPHMQPFRTVPATTAPTDQAQNMDSALALLTFNRGILASFSNLRPFTVRADGLCGYAFNLISTRAQVVRIVLSSPPVP